MTPWQMSLCHVLVNKAFFKCYNILVSRILCILKICTHLIQSLIQTKTLIKERGLEVLLTDRALAQHVQGPDLISLQGKEVRESHHVCLWHCESLWAFIGFGSLFSLLNVNHILIFFIVHSHWSYCYIIQVIVTLVQILQWVYAPPPFPSLFSSAQSSLFCLNSFISTFISYILTWFYVSI